MTAATPPHTAAPSPRDVPDPEQNRARLECLVLEACHVLDAYLSQPSEDRAEELAHLREALLAATNAEEDLCEDLLGVARQMEEALAAEPLPMSTRGAA